MIEVKEFQVFTLSVPFGYGNRRIKVIRINMSNCISKNFFSGQILYFFTKFYFVLYFEFAQSGKNFFYLFTKILFCDVEVVFRKRQ